MDLVCKNKIHFFLGVAKFLYTALFEKFYPQRTL